MIRQMEVDELKKILDKDSKAILIDVREEGRPVPAHDRRPATKHGVSDDARHLSGLIDVEALRCAYDAERSGQNAHRSAPGRPPVGGWSGGGRGDEMSREQVSARVSEDSSPKDAKTHVSKGNGKNSSYPQVVPLAAAAK